MKKNGLQNNGVGVLSKDRFWNQITFFKRKKHFDKLADKEPFERGSSTMI